MLASHKLGGRSPVGCGSARSRGGDWQIEAGKTEIIKHRLICYTGELNDVTMTGQWNDYIGNHSIYSDAALWGIAQEEGRAAEFLTPQKAVDQMTIEDGFEVNVWVAEPDITQPMAFCWDDRGRLWVAENRDYESRGDGFSNGGDSRILILEDSNGDGSADARKVFAEGIPFPAALAVGFEGVFVGAPPNLLFIPDKDQNDKADMADIEVRLTGWGIRDRHETLNSFHWGPDGWLYGTEGFATPSKVRKPNGKGKLYGYRDPFPEDLLEADGVDIDGGVWRYHPTKDKFEVVAHGFSNPWGIDYDAKGQFFITACVIPHMFHIINGGIYHRQGGKHFNPYVYSDIQTIVDHRHRSAHGGARIYQSDAFPSEYQGQLFMANIHEHAVLVDKLSPKGSGYVASHGSDFMMANNAQWVGFSMEIGPDGGVYVLDWHDADICGKEVINKETGRVFRIMPKKSQAKEFPGRRTDLKKMSDQELVNLQKSGSDWHTRRARVVLQSRAAAGTIESNTKELIRNEFTAAASTDLKLKYLWSNFVIDGWTNDDLIMLLSDGDPYIRSWAVQMLMEDDEPSSAIKNTLVDLAKSEGSPVTRLTLASVMQRMDHQTRWRMAEVLVQFAEDQDDHNIPKMLWFGIEPLIAQDVQMGLELAGVSKIDHVTRCIARRIVDAGKTDVLVAELFNYRQSIKSLLEGLREGLEGMTSGTAPKGWDQAYSDLGKDTDLADLAMEIAQKFGNAEVAKSYLASLQNKSGSTADKVRALKGLAEQQNGALVNLLPSLMTDPQLGTTALQAVAHYDEESLGRAIGDRYQDFTAAQKEQAILTMASRPRYGRMLTQALAAGRVSKSDVPAYVARQLRRVVGNGFVEVWGPIDLVSTDVEATYNKYRELLAPDALAQANLASGKSVFKKVCASCHQLYGEGGLIGPDITGSNRTDIEYLLSNLIEPSFDIQDDYKMTIVTTQDGRTHIGTIAAENDRQVTLRVVGTRPCGN